MLVDVAILICFVATRRLGTAREVKTSGRFPSSVPLDKLSESRQYGLQARNGASIGSGAKMVGYRLLHLSDIHWDDETAEDQKIIIGKLKDDLEVLVRDGGKIDIIIFSGDLVHKGQDATSFPRAKEALLDVVRNSLGLSANDILICPGNHDVNRATAKDQDYVEAGLKAKLKNTDRLNEHVDKFLLSPPDKDDSNVRLANYFSFVRTHYNRGATLATNYVDCVVKKTALGNIGFALLNTAWRSSGDGEIERNQMLLGERVVDKAAEQLKECSFKIAIMHHPTDWLAPWNAKSVRTSLFVNFDLVLFGHVHESMPSLIENTIGECLLAQGGCLYEHRDYYNGYQVIDITIGEPLEFDFHLRTWFNAPRRAFGPAENICAGGRRLFRLRSHTAGPRKMQVQEWLALQSATDEMANAHLKTLQLESDITFDESFTPPLLSYKTEDELLQLPPQSYKKNLVELSDIVSEEGVIVFSGARESGKSTIALKIAKEILAKEGGPLKVPVLVDFSILRKYDALDQLARRHFVALKVDIFANTVIVNHRCVFIVDNVSLAENEKVERLKKLIRQNRDKHDWILFLDRIELLSRKNIVDEFEATKPPIFIQPFGRREIRTLITKISPAVPSSIESIDTIIKLISDNDLPRSAYIVTLLVSVLTRITVDAVINEATLLDKMIDLLLNKYDPNNVLKKQH